MSGGLCPDTAKYTLKLCNESVTDREVMQSFLIESTWTRWIRTGNNLELCRENCVMFFSFIGGKLPAYFIRVLCIYVCWLWTHGVCYSSSPVDLSINSYARKQLLL